MEKLIQVIKGKQKLTLGLSSDFPSSPTSLEVSRGSDLPSSGATADRRLFLVLRTGAVCSAAPVEGCLVESLRTAETEEPKSLRFTEAVDDPSVPTKSNTLHCIMSLASAVKTTVT